MKIWSISSDIFKSRRSPVIKEAVYLALFFTRWWIIAIIYSTLRAKKLHLQEMAVKPEKSDDIMTWKTAV